jgi:hypothetical protein
MSVKENIEELHIHENAIKDDTFVEFCIEPISQMKKLKHLNIAKNGCLTKASIVGLVKRMTEIWEIDCEENPTLVTQGLPLEKLNI